MAVKRKTARVMPKTKLEKKIEKSFEAKLEIDEHEENEKIDEPKKENNLKKLIPRKYHKFNRG